MRNFFESLIPLPVYTALIDLFIPQQAGSDKDDGCRILEWLVKESLT